MTIAETEVELIEELEDHHRATAANSITTDDLRPFESREVLRTSLLPKQDLPCRVSGLAIEATSADEEYRDRLCGTRGRRYVSAIEDESCLTHEAPTSQNEAPHTTPQHQSNVAKVAVLHPPVVIRSLEERHHGAH